MNKQATAENEDHTAVLLEFTRQLTVELHPNHPPSKPITIDSRFDKDLGLDSLARVELIGRIEQRFARALPEQLLSEVETPRDLLRALKISPSANTLAVKIQQQKPQLHEVTSTPIYAETLLDVLDWHMQNHPERLHVRFYNDGARDQTLQYQQLYQGAQTVAAGLQAKGLRLGEAVALMLPTEPDYFFSFFGILLAGGVPVPIYPPVRLNQLEDHLNRQKTILASSKAKFLITVKQGKTIAKWLRSQLVSLQRVLTVADLTQQNAIYQRPKIDTNHTAFLQYTSGSTGYPKGVVLSHANLLANIRAMGQAIKANSNDVFVSWLPLYHDMGLIGALLGVMYHSAELVIMSPLAFLKKPQTWLWAIHQYRGTLSAAPNFAFEICSKRITDQEIEGLDLSSLRMVFNGAEPVSSVTLDRFSQRFADYGLKANAMTPVYGLAENSVGLTFPPLDRGPLVDCIDQDLLANSGRAQTSSDTGAKTLKVVSCGYPLQGHQIRIADETGRELPERKVGRLQFQGPSATSGYFRNSQATKNLFDGLWLDSGDLAYIAKGEIYITGRSKDVIIRGGRNIYPQQLELAIGELAGIRKGCVAVFGSTDHNTGTERLIVLAERRESNAEILDSLRQEINALAVDLLTMPTDEIVLAPPQTVLKTSSGKIRRAACRELFELDRLGKKRKIGWQFSRLLLSSVLPMARRLSRNIIALSYNCYAYANLILLAPMAWLGALTLPKLTWRWQLIHRLAQLLQITSRTSITISGRLNIPIGEPVIFMVNHASYIDSFVIAGLLRQPARFVGKSELQSNPLLKQALANLGVQFVDRYDQQKSAEGAKLLTSSLNGGASLIIFPEGTFTRLPGLLPFRMGGFVAAATTRAPIIPITLRGTRNILRADSWFIRRGVISINIGKPVNVPNTIKDTNNDHWQSALELRNRVRSEILRHCGEPDLAHEKDIQGVRP